MRPETSNSPEGTKEPLAASEIPAAPEILSPPEFFPSLIDPKLFPHSPENRCAKKLLPEIFWQGEKKQSEIFEEVGEIISKLEKNTEKGQQKIPSGRWYSDGEPIYPLYCFRGPSGKLRYFFSPKTHQLNAGIRKRVNLLGKGTQGIVIPGYELTQDPNGRWSLSKEATPTIAIKISEKTAPLDLKKVNERIEKELTLAKKFYGDEITVFSKPLRRQLHKVDWNAPDSVEPSDYHKIYIAMEYLPGVNGRVFCGIYGQILHVIEQKILDKEQKKIHSLHLFLEALDYCLSLIDQVIQAHDKGILLRDIKPGNLILNEGKTTLIDFGLSEFIENAGGLRRGGTGIYAAPETLEEKPMFSVSSDTFSTVISIAHLLGLNEHQYNNQRMFKPHGKIPEPPKVTPEKKDASDEAQSKGKSEAKPAQTSCQVNPVIKNLAENSPDRITEALLAHIPIGEHIKKSLLQTMKGAVDPDPDERPALADIRNVLKIAQKDALGKLEELAPGIKELRKKRKIQQKEKAEEKKASLVKEKRKTVEEYKVEIADFYQHIYRKANAPELEAVNKVEKTQKCDRLNFLAWLVTQNTFQAKFGGQNKILLFFCEHFELKSEILLTDNFEANIQAINAKANEMNRDTQIMTRWQFHRIYEDYEKKKDQSFLGYRWFTQSVESAKAIRKASEAKTPQARHEALINGYLEKKPRSSLLFFPAPKENSERTLGRSIMQFRTKA